MVKTKKRYSKISTYGQAALGTFLWRWRCGGSIRPQSMVTGGFSGIGIVLNRILPIPVSVTTLVLNIPLFLYSWRKKGFSVTGKKSVGDDVLFPCPWQSCLLAPPEMTGF